MNKARSTKEVFDHHMKAFAVRDMKAIAMDFAPNVVYINSLGVKLVGVDNVMKVYKQYFDSLEKGSMSEITQLIIEGDIVYLEWRVDSPSSYIHDGVDTFVIRDGLIQAQTARFTVVPKRSGN